jgi:hypothetical protein
MACKKSSVGLFQLGCLADVNDSVRGDTTMTPYQLGFLVGRTLVAFIFFMLIIGGSYYLLKRHSLPFRQAVLRWWVITLSLCFSGIVLLITLLSFIGTSAQQESSHVYPADAVSGFTEACVDTSKAGLGSAAAERLCTCAITELQKAYTYGEFKKLSADLQKTAVPSTGLSDIFNRCARK